MAGSDKTEKPTPKKKRDTRRKGQIAKSQDLTGWTSLLIGTYLLPLTIGRLAEVTRGSLYELRGLPSHLDGDVAVEALGHSLRDAFVALIPLLGVVALTGLFVTLGQTGLVLSLKPLVPDFKRVNPIQGVKRLFSPRSAWETVKQVLKIAVVIAVAGPRVMSLVDSLAGGGRLPLGAGLEVAGDGILGVVRSICWVMLVVSVADYGYQRYQHSKDLRMTKQEVRDEYKNAEGDQQVKGRIRALQRSMARNQMLAGMGDADVVITNPTHISVALRYDPTVARAPIVVAVGANTLAMRIREAANEHSVPILEAKPLARALWRACDPGDEIPTAVYEAVAQVLAFVRHLDRRLSVSRVLELPHHTKLDADALDAIPKKRRRIAA